MIRVLTREEAVKESNDRINALSAEIADLKAINAELVEALQRIVDEADSDDGLAAWDGSDIARAALAKAKRPQP